MDGMERVLAHVVLSENHFTLHFQDGEQASGNFNRLTGMVSVEGEEWGTMQFYLDAREYGFSVAHRQIMVEDGVTYLHADVTCNGVAWQATVDCSHATHSFFTVDPRIQQ